MTEQYRLKCLVDPWKASFTFSFAKIYLKVLHPFNLKGAFFWDYSGIGILGIDGICVLFGAIPFSE